jgi:hypothetical protein
MVMNQRLLVGLMVLASMPLACAGKKGASPSASAGGNDWVVLPEKEAQALKMPCSRSFPPDLSGYWKLTDTDIDRAETRFQEALIRALGQVSNDQRERSPALWHAQYAGFLRNGHKVVYVNAIGSDGLFDQGWRDRAIILCDGGLQSFGAVLDLDRDTVDSFEFNGTVAGSIRMRDATSP